MNIVFDLLTNARDSLDRAMELIAYGEGEPEPRRLKQAVLSVAHAIELLLKERLRRLHPSLIWEQVDKYPNLNARTVSSELAAMRLQRIGGIAFRKADLDLLRSLRATRNAIEHFSWTTTKSEADAIVGRALEFAFQFAAVELDIEYLDYSAHRDGTYQDLIEANGEFKRAREARKSNRSEESEGTPLLCSFCRGRAVDPKTRGCRLCGHWEPEPWDGPWGGDNDHPF